MIMLKVNGIELRVLAGEGFNTSEQGTNNQVWTAAGSYLSNKQSVSRSYRFKCGPFNQEEIKFVEQLINGHHDFFPMKNGLESTTGLQPRSHYLTRVTNDGAEVKSKLKYDLQLVKDNMVFIGGQYGTHIYDYNTNSVTNSVPIGLDIYTMNDTFTLKSLFGVFEPVNFMIRSNCKVPDRWSPLSASEWGESPYVNVSGALIGSSTKKMLGRAGVVEVINSELSVLNVELFEVYERYVRSR